MKIDMKEMKISFFNKFGSEAETKLLSQIMNEIKDGEYKIIVDNLRQFDKNESKYGELKKKLPHFTPSGTFEQYRKRSTLGDYSSIIVLDFDNLGEDSGTIRNRAAEIEYTLACFVSPSNRGVKVLVNTDSEPENHENAYAQVAGYYEKALNVTVDNSGKDVSRACFVSYDPEAFYNESASEFSVSTNTEIVKFSDANYSVNPDELFFNVVNLTKKIEYYRPGNRNNFIYLLANNLNRVGMNENVACDLIARNFSDSDIQKEIAPTVKSAYSNTKEHGIFSLEYVSSASSAMAAKPKIMQTTPLISSEVYRNLPELLKKSSSVFEIDRERDIFLTAALAVLSGCFDNVSGTYDNREFHPNLYCFISTPPAGGKGNAIFARELAQVIHENIMDSVDTSESSKFTHFIPADSSSAAVKRTLKKNSGIGTICETEADTLSTTLKQDWGGFDDLLRKAYQHETVSYSRADENEEVILQEIRHPRLSVCLTGTPDQVSTLLKSAENGLFSRFMFYTYRHETTPKFKNVFAKDNTGNRDDYFRKLSKEVYAKKMHIESVGKIQFQLTENQEEKFVGVFDDYLQTLHESFGEEVDSIVFRLGLITFRIAMLLNILRASEEENIPNEITCSDADFDSSINLSRTYLEHSLAVLNILPERKIKSSNATVLMDFLPESFSYSDAVKIGTKLLSLSEKSVSNYLGDLLKNSFLKQPIKNGQYFKT